jgi:type IV secretory pathway TraG/TraD family ATPase VirD4
MEIFRRLETVSLKHPLTLIADELPSIGHVEAIETIGPEGRKHGIRLIGVIQDLEGLQRVYPQSWGGFLSNADATVFMSINHKPTIDYLFQKLGTATRSEKVDAGWWSLFSRIRTRAQKIERPLLYGTQIEDFLHPDAKNVIVLRYGRPLKLKNAIYYLELPVYAYEANPMYPEARGRRIGRALCRRFIPGPAVNESGNPHEH